MPGPAPKPANRRQRTNRKAAAIVPFPRSKVLKVPAIPPKLLASTRAMWNSFWESPLAQAVELETDLPAICRLFSLYDERQRSYEAYRRERLITGSQGQRVLNPMARAMQAFDGEIRQLEDRLGLTPRARLQLGIQLGEAAKSLAQLNRLLDEDNHGENEEDPRV